MYFTLIPDGNEVLENLIYWHTNACACVHSPTHLTHAPHPTIAATTTHTHTHTHTPASRTTLAHI